MHSIEMSQASSSLSNLVDAIEQGQEREILIIRNGRPAARLVPVERRPAGQRIGIAKGKFEVPDDIDAHNEEVAQLFTCCEPPKPAISPTIFQDDAKLSGR